MNPQEIIHRHALVAMGILVALTVAITAFAQLTGSGKQYRPEGESTATVELRFEDQAGGLVAVFNARTGAQLAEYGMDEGVFVRSVMRGVARQRRLRGDTSRAPVILSLRENDRLWLSDPSTDVHIFLGAFGPDNSGAFAALLNADTQVASRDRSADAS